MASTWMHAALRAVCRASAARFASVTPCSTASRRSFSSTSLACLLAGSAVVLHASSSSTDAPPPPFTPLPVVGGHAGMTSNGRVILKPLQNDARGAREKAFYESMFHSQPDPDATAFLPRYHGAVTHPADGTACLALEDVTARMRRAAVMDVKIGVTSHSPDATPAKAAAEKAKYPLMASLGVRVTGVRSWSGGVACEKGRAFGYALTGENLYTAWEAWLYDGTRVRSELIPPLLAKLRGIQAWMARQRRVRLYGSSLLFVYDAEGEDEVAARPDVRMIDFAHAWPMEEGEEGRDEGYLVGLATVISQLEKVQAMHAAPKDSRG